LISLYIGLPGSGKTTISAANMYKSLKRLFKYRKKDYQNYKGKEQYEFVKGCNVWSNMPLKGAQIIDLEKDLMKVNIERGILLIDEAGIEYNNRDFKTFSKEALMFFKLHRHYELDVHFYSQDVDIDKKLVSLADTVYITERSLIPYFVYTKAIKRKFDVIDGQIKAVFSFVPFILGGHKYYYCPKYWKLFDSWHRNDYPNKVWERWNFEISENDMLGEEKEEDSRNTIDDYLGA